MEKWDLPTRTDEPSWVVFHELHHTIPLEPDLSTV